MNATGLFINLLKSVLGSGILSMPFCLHQMGMYPGILAMLIVYLFTCITSMQLFTCWKILKLELSRDSSEHFIVDAQAKGLPRISESVNVVSYYQLCEKTFKKQVVSPVVFVSVVLSQWFTCVSFSAFILENLRLTFGRNCQWHLLFLTATIITLCMQRNMHHLSFSSAVGNMLFFLSMVLVLGVSEPTSSQEKMHSFSKAKREFAGPFGVLCATFSIHLESLSLFNSCSTRSHRDMKRTIITALTFLFILLTSYSIVFSYKHGDQTEDNIFLHLPQNSRLSLVVRLAMISVFVCTFPIACFPIFHVIETTWIRSDARYNWRAIRAAIVLSCFLFAEGCTSSFESILTIIGGLTAVNSLVLPPLFYLRIACRGKIPRLHRYACYGIALTGVYLALKDTLLGVRGFSWR